MQTLTGSALHTRSALLFAIPDLITQGQEETLTYSIDSGCMGNLTVTIGSVQYVYKLSDIVGRVEVAL